MHGRQKKERTAEEEVLKQKEQTKKMTAYRRAMGLIFSKRCKNELDEELLKITGQVLSSNPDIGTLWNIRKEVLACFKENDHQNFLDVIVPKELEFTEFCLKNNPKSYGAWHHRYWIMIETNFVKAPSELKLCAKYLEYDDRNFHGWDYRRFLVQNSPNVTLEQEIDFTTEKISSNFSNFSSWHLRSKLLPKLSKDYLDEELELIRNAVFTDPKDQSAWFYHRWLLKSQLAEGNPSIVAVQLQGPKCIFIFDFSVLNPSQTGVKIKSASAEASYDIDVSSNWTNPWSNTRSKLWEYTFRSPTEKVIVEGTESIMKNMQSSEIKLSQGDIMINFPCFFDVETQPKNDKLVSVFKEELNWVMELQELEPDIKWPISTIIMLMRMIDFVGYKNEILTNLESLIKLDLKRINYYIDLRSKYLIEWKLLENQNNKSPSTTLQNTLLDFSALGLTALYYPERMFFRRRINLSGNALKNSEPFRALLNCDELNISGNKLLPDVVKSAINKELSSLII